jgi:hypothetical protein
LSTRLCDPKYMTSCTMCTSFASSLTQRSIMTCCDFCQHTRLAFLARNVPPDVMMRPVDVNFEPGRGDRGSGIVQQNGFVPASVLVQDSIVLAILQRGLGNTFATLSVQELAWVCMIVELPHHQGGLGITPLPSSGMATFYSATAQMVSWLGSLPHVSQWVADQNLADPSTWKCSSLKILKLLHEKLKTHYNCAEWAPPPAADAPAPDAPAQGRDDDSPRPLSLPPLNLLASLRTRQVEENGEASNSSGRPSLPAQRQVTKRIMQNWLLHQQMLRNCRFSRRGLIRAEGAVAFDHACVTCTCFITPNWCS